MSTPIFDELRDEIGIDLVDEQRQTSDHASANAVENEEVRAAG